MWNAGQVKESWDLGNSNAVMDQVSLRSQETASENQNYEESKDPLQIL